MVLSRAGWVTCWRRSWARTAGVQGCVAALRTSGCTHLTGAAPGLACSAATDRAWAGGHGGTRHHRTWRRLQTWAVHPAASAGGQDRHRVAAPLPVGGAGCGHGGRTRACGTPQVSEACERASGWRTPASRVHKGSSRRPTAAPGGRRGRVARAMTAVLSCQPGVAHPRLPPARGPTPTRWRTRPRGRRRYGWPTGA